MRILTAQSQEVLDIILKDGEYRPDLNRRRCQNDIYSVDIQLLDGQAPIYGVKLTEYDYLVEAYNGWMIQRHLEILRAFDEESYGHYRFLELEIPDRECYYSKYHNGGNEWVFPSIQKDYLLSAFRLHEYPDELHSKAWYYRKVEVLYVGGVRPVLYEEDFDALDYNLNHSEEIDALERRVHEAKRKELRASIQRMKLE